MVTRKAKLNTVRALIAALAALAVLFPLSALASGYNSGDNTVIVSDNVVFDPNTNEFVFTAEEGGAQVRTTVLDGMVVSNNVTVRGGGVFMYRNGDEYDGSLDPISEPGEYVVMLATGERSVRMLAFTIVGSTTNVVTTYKVPSGMLVTNAERDGEQVYFEYSSVPMNEEGSYRIITECIASGTVYTLETTVDRTPPDLKFEGTADKGGRYNSAVKVSGIRRDETLSVTRDGSEEKIEVASDGTAVLTESGRYVLRAFDAAGNSSEYVIMITAYLNAGGVAFVVLAAAALAAVVIYVLTRRKKLRIG